MEIPCYIHMHIFKPWQKDLQSFNKIWPRGYKTWVHSQTQNKALRLAACLFCYTLNPHFMASFRQSVPDITHSKAV